jgi:ABC-2 type transport system permease protein
MNSRSAVSKGPSKGARSVGAFFKKELMEYVKTPKLLILCFAFLLFGLLSPITAKYINELIAGVGALDLKLPDPTYLDAYVQFFKNMYSLNILIVVMIFMGLVVDEKVKGSILLTLTKGLSRTAFILGKFFSALLVFSLSYLLAVGACLYYTHLLFPEFVNPGVPIAFLLFWLYGVLMIAFTLFCSTLAKTHTVAAVGSFVAFALIALTGTLPRVGVYLPGYFNSLGMELVMGVASMEKAVLPGVISFSITVMVLLFTLLLFRRQEL